ncbi:MAG TPA: NADH-quinone oxidoreductase subunit M [Anaerolineaceae bacterium]|nr:NADH-quinone oxidoreductase subunit M [Anaerolineaceae bacterium]HPN50676.1 NADH-quinone oxidoreductase subunit M [Anaerolineaceae bacterium]
MEYGLNPLIVVTFFPLLGFLVILFLRETQKEALRWTALLTSLITFGLSLWLLAGFQQNSGDFQMIYDLTWLKIGPALIRLQMGVDGISILMVLLTTFLTPLAILSTWTAVKEKVKGFMLFFMMLETGMLGVFLALDMVLFYVFWEFTLIPMYFLIGIWGGKRRIDAAIKFFLFTMTGSLVMLVAIIFLGLTMGSFSLPELMAANPLIYTAQLWLFLGFGLAFAIKVPLWPFHTWLPDAHVEAPTAGSVILAGVLLKMGTYGFLRFNLPLFPDAARSLAPWIGTLAVAGILYGAVVSWAQKDLKKLVAYSSVSHLGFVMLGIFAFTVEAAEGAVLQMINHGLSTGALFLIVGMLYERRHTRELNAFGGLWKQMPILGSLALVVFLSSLGLPGLNGFVGEFLILAGTFVSPVLNNPWFAILAALGVIWAAVYLLHAFQKVFLGPLKNEANLALKDLNWREIITLIPLLVLIFWLGLYPQPFINLMAASVEKLLK